MIGDKREAKWRLLAASEFANRITVSSTGNDWWIEALLRMELTLMKISERKRQIAAGAVEEVNLPPQPPENLSPGL